MTLRTMRMVAGAAALAAVCAGGMSAQTANPYIKAQTEVRQLPVNRGATALWEELQRLKTRASLLMIVAHPDDEDGGMLTKAARGEGVRTGMLTLNRGEGGQNVMTGDFNDALGLLRTQELLAADQYLGVDEQMFGSVADFGFSKTMEETLQQWGYDRVLCDAVLAVRRFRPMVVTSVFIGGVTDGHGHHQVAGRLAQEMYDKAGDASVCPDQIAAGLKPWQPLKVYERVPEYSISTKGIYDYATGKYAPAKFYDYGTKTWSDTTPSTDVTVHEGDYSALLGMSYLQFARTGLGEQKTQNGGGALPEAGAFDVAYHRYASRVKVTRAESSFFDGIDTSLAGMGEGDAELTAGLKQMDADVAAAMRAFDVKDAAKTAPALAEGWKQASSLLAELDASKLNAAQKDEVREELLRKQAEFNDALVDALGLTMRAQVGGAPTSAGLGRVPESGETQLAAVPGEKIDVRVVVNNPAKEALSGLRESVGGEEFDGTTLGKDGTLGGNVPVTHVFHVTVDAAPTRPYFTRPGVEQAYYDIADAKLRGEAETPYPVTAWATAEYDGAAITLGEVVQTAHRVVGEGVVYQPLTVVPAISVALQPAAGIVPLGAKTIHLTAQVRGDGPEGGSGTVKLRLPEGWTAEPASAAFDFTHRGGQTAVEFAVTPKDVTAQEYTISAVAESGGKEFTEGYRTVGYAGLTPTNLYSAAVWKARGVDVKVADGVRVAYLPGTGDEVPEYLAALGVDVHTLTMTELATADLKQWDEIVVGVRAYTAHAELSALSARLLEFAKAGGVVVVQYQSAPFASTEGHAIAPYPLALSGMTENVVEETAPVTLLKPEHPLLTWPNRITAEDFDGWVEERGHSFLRTWDAKYDALTETHDTGQDAQRGGLLYARTGCGAYVYVAYALYRQLPEGVPGAYRIYANLLSLPKLLRGGRDASPGCAETSR